ncbi:MAG TPA: hypothetical protein DET40_10755 [Lentisphaeria bacterium]|nr:MAG: hypothetical protein A2X45_11575 [Lentisphaerae bacterium GWF2_50_93]HCE44018.1 hypothetical protein [Lentisphaeria bacterium]
MMIAILFSATQWAVAQDQKKTKDVKEPKKAAVGNVVTAKAVHQPIPVPLKNGDFESPMSKGNKWAGWSLPEGGDFKVITDAHGGKQAIHIGVPYPYLIQEIDTSSLKGKFFEVSFYAKGTGTLGCWSHDKTGWTLQGYGELQLYPEGYVKYVLRDKNPISADKMELFFGKTYDCCLDDVSVAVWDKLPEPGPHETGNYDVNKNVPLPPQYFTGNGEIPEGMVNIAPYASIRTTPFVPGANRIVDGYMGSAATTWCHMVEFSFDKPQTVSSVRIGLPAKEIFIFADKDGNGKYIPLAIDTESWSFGYWGRPSWPWYHKEFSPPVKVRSIRFYNVGHEVQILSAKSDAAALVEANKEKMPDIPEMASGAAVATPEAARDDQILVGFTIEPWMFNSQSEIDKDDNPKRPLKDWDGWKKLIADYKDMKANFILLFPPQTCIEPPKDAPRKGTYPSAVLWPSKAWYRSCQKNILAEICASAHENGIKVFPVFRDYALNEGATVSELNKEMFDSGVDAIPMSHDEQMFSIGGIGQKQEVKPGMSPAEKNRVEDNNRRLADEVAKFDKLNQLITEEAKKLPEPERSIKMFNSVLNYPTKQSDDSFRRLVLLRYDAFGDAIAKNAAATRAVKPDVPTFSAFTCTEELKSSRIEHFSENDVVGFKAGIDMVGGTSGYFTINDKLGWPKASYYTQVYRACTPKRQSMHTMNLAWGYGFFGDPKKNPLCEDVYPPVAYIGNTLAAVFNKAVALDFWRYKPMEEVPLGKESISEAFHMTDTASAWGAKNASIPKDVLFLRSRASEDWWGLRVDNDKNEKDKSIADKGVDQAQWLGNLLIRNAFPFELYWQDQPQAYEPVIDKFKVIVLSLPYSVSDAELKVLEKAASANIPIIAVGARGETDGFGDKRTVPALDALIKAGKIQVFDKDIQHDGNFRSTENEFVSLLDKNIGHEKRSLMLKRYGDKDVQAAMLEIKPDEKLVLLVNWSMSEATVDLGMNLPAGKDYKLLYRDRKGTSEMSIGGKTSLKEADLRQFRVKMKNGDVGILRIFR